MNFGAIGQAAVSAIPAPGSSQFVALTGALSKKLMGIIMGCGNTCRQAAQYANDAEVNLKAVNERYFATANRTASDRAAALTYIDGVLEWLGNGCRAVGGDAGNRCISERLVRGGSAPWCPSGTGCDWLTLYRDPIANDAVVTGGGVGGGVGGGTNDGLLGNLFGGGGSGSGGMSPILLIVIAVVVVVKMRKK